MKSLGHHLILIVILNITCSILVSCDEESNNDKTLEPPSGYSLVSIDYDLIHAAPLRLLSTERLCANNSSVESYYTFGKDLVILTSFFDDPDEKPEYTDLIRQVKVPLPVIDMTCSIAGLSDVQIPFEFKTTNVEVVDMKHSLTVPIPPATTYKGEIYINGASLSTRFTCILENIDTKERLTLTGGWRGMAFYEQEIIVSDKNGNINKESAQPVIY